MQHFTGRYHFPDLGIDVNATMLHDAVSTMRLEPVASRDKGVMPRLPVGKIEPWQMTREDFLACVDVGEFVFLPGKPTTAPCEDCQRLDVTTEDGWTLCGDCRRARDAKGIPWPSAKPAKTAEDWERERQEAAAKAEAERATWPQLYATVREAVALGFTPGAYGNITDKQTIYAPPTKFYYTAGPVRWPHHADQAQAAMFIVFSHAKGTPDALRDEPTWAAGDAQGYLCPGPYHTKYNLTLPQALAHAIACARHYERHFLAPTWHDGCPELTAAEWRELAALPIAAPEPETRDMFAPPPPETDEARAQKAITLVAAGRFHTDRIRIKDRRAIYGIERLLERANYERSRQPLPELDAEPQEAPPMPRKKIDSPPMYHAPKTTPAERAEARERVRAWGASKPAATVPDAPIGEQLTIDAEPGTYTVLADIPEPRSAPPAPAVPLTQAALF